MHVRLFMRAAVAALSLAVSLSSASAQTATTHAEMHKLHSDPKAYASALDDPKRDEYQRPHEVMMALDVKAGEIIADIGAGTGYFALRLARHVGASGHVYAVDVNPDMMRILNARIRDAKGTNVTGLLAEPDDPLLPEAVNRFLVVDVWHHIDDQAAYLAKMKALLKPGGEVIMIDFHKRELPVGPPAAMKIAREDLIAQMQTHGFVLSREHTMLPYQYFLVFTMR
jgi:ubiquinone/menaquinone biosynthesis C-methylase UbiE